MKLDKATLKKLASPRKVIGYFCSLAKTKQKNRTLRIKGSKTVAKLQSIMQESGVFFYFDMGTLLGIIREGRLLSHDLDIDIAVFVDSNEEKNALRSFLLKSGCCLQRSYSIKNGGCVEDSFCCNDIKFDVNYYERQENVDVCYLMYRVPGKVYEQDVLDVVKLTNPHVERVVQVNFNNVMVNVPENPEDYLAVRYGENWRIPDRKYVYWKGPSTSPTDLEGILEIH